MVSHISQKTISLYSSLWIRGYIRRRDGESIVEEVCEICKQKFVLEENPAGVVFDDIHFICEKCHQQLLEEDVEDERYTLMGENRKGMPIAVWLIHEQNKDKPFMAVKREE